MVHTRFACLNPEIGFSCGENGDTFCNSCLVSHCPHALSALRVAYFEKYAVCIWAHPRNVNELLLPAASDLLTSLYCSLHKTADNSKFRVIKTNYLQLDASYSMKVPVREGDQGAHQAQLNLSSSYMIYGTTVVVSGQNIASALHAAMVHVLCTRLLLPKEIMESQCAAALQNIRLADDTPITLDSRTPEEINLDKLEFDLENSVAHSSKLTMDVMDIHGKLTAEQIAGPATPSSKKVAPLGVGENPYFKRRIEEILAQGALKMPDLPAERKISRIFFYLLCL